MRRIALHDLLYGIYLCAMLFIGHDNVDRHLEQRNQVFFGQLCGSHCDVVFFFRIRLRVKEMIDGLYHFLAVFQHNKEDQEPMSLGGRWIGILVFPQGGQCIDKQVGYGDGQQ